ncbi:MAG TPA: hypothetical protein VND45_07740 [Thermoanaerobaculia bacterium]|nr:hypothetical protein [Thermoanaerobaculia bacterium]
MRKAVGSTLLLLALAMPASAASATDFYLTLLRRGTADVEAGRHADATTNLRLAAFGLVESIEHYETALAYLAVALDRVGQRDQAREAAQRIIAAEKVEKRFRAIAFPATIRTAFDAVAKKVLSATDAAALSGGATAQPVIVDRIDVTTESRGTNGTVTPSTPLTKPAQTPAPQPQPPRPQSTTPPPQNSATQNNTQPKPQATQPPAPKPEPAQPQTAQPQTAQPQPAQPQNTPQSTKPQTVKPQNTTPRPQTTQPPAPKPQPAQPQRSIDVNAQLAAAERALTAAKIDDARRIYRELLTLPALDHGTLIRIGEGLYRARDFASVLTAFDRAGTLRYGEEPYRYYVAVAAYESRQFERARRELAAALPWIEITPDVQRYRVKIEGGR